MGEDISMARMCKNGHIIKAKLDCECKKDSGEECYRCHLEAYHLKSSEKLSS